MGCCFFLMLSLLGDFFLQDWVWKLDFFSVWMKQFISIPKQKHFMFGELHSRNLTFSIFIDYRNITIFNRIPPFQ